MASDTGIVLTAEPKAEREKGAVAVKEFGTWDPATSTFVVVDDIAKANAFSYKSIKEKDAKGEPTAFGKTAVIKLAEWDPNVVIGSPITMAALFGVSTLATNHASFNRRAAKDDDRFEDDADAVEERFARIAQGDWGAKGGGGFGIDVNVLFDAITELKGGDESWTDKAAWIAAMNENTQTRRDLRNHSKIAPIYERMIRERRAPKVEKDLDALLGLGT